jgi:predicted transposase YbfD/YdcC
LKPLDIEEYVVTADAIQTQRANAEFIVSEKKAHYLFPVKENQPNLLQALIDESLISREHDAESLEKGHGRIEKRTLWIYEAPANIKESFPFVEQICAIERTRTVLGNEEKTTTEVSYYVTSLSRNDAAASTILSLIRGHWIIESKVHHCLDVAFDEDRCRARTGNLPFVLSALKKAVMTIFRAFGVRNITAARQQLAHSL